jgi:hypothetical protein
MQCYAYEEKTEDDTSPSIPKTTTTPLLSSQLLGPYPLNEVSMSCAKAQDGVAHSITNSSTLMTSGRWSLSRTQQDAIKTGE